MRNFLKFLENIFYKIKLLVHINKLEIEETGKDENGNYVKLKKGKYFYGIPTRSNLHKYYFLLSQKQKKVIKFSSLQTVYDIIIRYYERGLKLGGPKKEMFYNLKEGDIVAEMGAYLGYYTLYLSEKVGNTGKIVAIEPLPDNLEYLKNNIIRNNIKNVSIVPKGVWKEKGKMTFFQNKDDHQSASLILDKQHKIDIDVDSLDNILKDADIDNVDFMIIQLNGVEYEALLGLTKIKPKSISIAARYDSDKIKTSEKIKQLLEQRNYDVKIVNKDYIFASLKE